MAKPLEIAQSLLGRGEVPDKALLQEFLQNGGQNLDPTTTAWCAAFVNASLGKAGVQGTGKLNARSFLDWGQPVDTPQKGDVAVFSRGDPNGWQGHVGFFEGYNPDGTIRVLGGNQGNAVAEGSYSPDDLLGFRRADGGNALQAGEPDYAARVNALAATLGGGQQEAPPPPWQGFLDPNAGKSQRRYG